MNPLSEDISLSRRTVLHISSFGLFMVFSSSRTSASTTPASSREAWAQPLALEGAPNLHRVTPTFYRSAQPTREGFIALHQKLDIKNVISLRRFHADDVLAGGTGLLLTRIPMNTWHIEFEDVTRALHRLHAAQQTGPVLLHCQHGADRTGLISALYRILYQDWSKADAIAEMRQGNFGYHAVWGNIPSFIKRVNINALKAAIAAL